MRAEEKKEPPRKDRRHLIDSVWADTPTPEFWARVKVSAQVLGRAGLVAELVVDGSDVKRFAARRAKPGKRGEE